ncbi:restriction endonuclease subunit S [Streptomyces tendae]|uniref:restriction endonuclease subunit S n=1 Tax=Streptomyces tendae TaxID=1932 RepID=UPI00371775EF
MLELPLGEALEVLIDHRGKTPKKLGGDFSSTGVPVVSALSVKGGRLNLAAARKIPWTIFDKWMPVRTKKYDVVLTSEAPLGSCALVQSDEPMALGQRLFGLRGRRGVLDGRFLFYALQSERIQGQLYGRSSGTTVLGIRQAELVKVRVPVPSISEQEAIAEVLGALDDKIALNEQLRETALCLGRSLLEGEVLEAGAAVKLRDVAELVYGKALPLPSRREGNVPVFGCTGQVGWHNTPLTDGKYPVVGRKGANAGHVSWMPRSGWVIDTAFYARPIRESLTSEALFFILDAAGISSLIADSAVPGVNRNAALDHKMLMPSPARMEQFARQACSLLASREQATNENRTLADLRDTLLPQLLSGKLRVKDAVRTVEEVV